MAKLLTHEDLKEISKEIVEEALNEYIYKGKTLREWIELLLQTRWIPVSEWMPIDTALKTLKRYSKYSDIRRYDYQYTKDVLLCDRNKDIRVGYWLASKYLRGWQVYGSKNYEPIAWMPLPDPYKAESEGKE